MAALALGAAGCGGDDEPRSAPAGTAATAPDRPRRETARTTTAPVPSRNETARTTTAPDPPRSETARTATAPRTTATPPRPALRPARCPTGLAGCRVATGRVLYVEAVDPDGDGDAHFVLAGGSVTAPGFSAIDVRAGLRPDPLPEAGDTVTAAGQVQTGSKGQSQIHAVEVRVRYRR